MSRIRFTKPSITQDWRNWQWWYSYTKEGGVAMCAI